MALNWQNNGETVRWANDGNALSHSSADVKGGDLVFVGVDNTDVSLKGVAMTDIVLAANVSEFHYNVGSVCRIGEWLFPAILAAAGTQFKKLNYNWTDKIWTDDATAGKIYNAAISMVDPKVQPNQLIDASGVITLTTLASTGGTEVDVVNEVFEIVITKSSDLGASTPVNAEFSIVGNNNNTVAKTGTLGTALVSPWGANGMDITLTHVAGVDLFEGQKFYVSTLGVNNGSNVVVGAGMLTEDTIMGAHMTVPTSTVAGGLNQDEGPQGNVGKLSIIINI